MPNSKSSSSKTASLAGKTLQSQSASSLEKKLAASALAQKDKKKQTSKKLETLASSVLKSTKESAVMKSLAASLVSQSNKSR